MSLQVDGGERRDLGAALLMPDEAERLVEGLREFDLAEVGSGPWLRQHGVLQKLNMQAHHSAQSQSDEFVLEALLTFEKLDTLVHELLAAELWADNVFPLVKAQLEERQAGMRAYFMLYQEAVLCNLLEVCLYHEHACEAMGETMMELVDYCARKITFLASGGHLRDAPAEDDDDDLGRQRADLRFRVAVVGVSMVRFIAEHISSCPVAVASRVLDTHDIIIAMVPLIENPPWTRRTDGGAWEKFVEQKWETVAPADLLQLTKTEGQAWLTLFHLMCNADCRSRYAFNSWRKATILRVRKYLNDVMLDQLPVLADVQRYMDELQIMAVPDGAASGPNALLMETVPVMREGIVAGRAFEDVGLHADVAADAGSAELRELAGLFATDEFLEMGAAEAPKCAQCGLPAEKRCSRCKTEWYCGRECQVAAWGVHKGVCDMVSSSSA